ncbi:MAG: hypothetical protein ACR2PO_20325 [Methyloligellaceae bacterium]
MSSDPKTESGNIGADEVLAWTGKPVSVDPRQILRVHRYTDPDAVRPAIRDAAERIARQVAELAAPVATYRRVPVESCVSGTLRLGEDVSFQCDAFDRLMGGCSHLIAFVLTLGPRLDDKVVDLMDEFEPLDALFVESAGWLSIELATRMFAASLRPGLEGEGLALGSRMGPGYSYRKERGGAERVEWRLEEQTKLFKLFGGKTLPVELLASCAMQPKMSRSGVFGVTTVRGGAS